ncbi:MAG: hypothetical protein V1798_10445 [Pseudomonadota bacterium]
MKRLALVASLISLAFIIFSPDVLAQPETPHVVPPDAQTETPPAIQPPPAQPIAQPQISAERTFGPYLNVGAGGDIALGGAAYTETAGIPGSGRTARFQFQAEGGTQYFALPVSLSYRQGVLILGAKPRVQYFLALIPGQPNLFLTPGLGFVANYWHVNADGLNPATNVFELGAQASIQIQYRLNRKLHFQLTPIALDFNFWRHFDQTQFGGPGNSTLFGLIYNVLLSFGYNF